MKIELENPVEGLIVADENQLFVYGPLDFIDVFDQRHFVQWGFLFDRKECEFQAAPIHNVLRDLVPPETELE